MVMPFKDVIGHAGVVALLRQAVRRGRVPQSLLIAGPEGVGKRALALALAQAVNCPRLNDGDGCGSCSVCTRIARNQFSDVVLIDKGDEASIKIRTIRERLLDVVGYRPFEGARRVYIIDPADAMTREAQDALLKTLEEPPAAAVIILISAYPDTLLPTIQSRCRRIRCGLLTEGDVARVLVERGGIDRATAPVLAAASGGSVARAMAERSGTFEADRDAALEFLAAQRGGVAQRLKAAAALAAHGTKRRDREALVTRLVITQTLLRDLAALNIASQVPLANADLTGQLEALAPTFGLERVTDAYAAVGRAEAALDRNASPKIVADWLAVSM
jgi:DNA polymerase-3 subunit delta'